MGNVLSYNEFGPHINPLIKYVEDENYFSELESLYSNVLDAAGLNIKDPVEAVCNSFFKEQKRQLLDPPKLGKTYIFVTRPDLNFEMIANVRQVSLFNYMANNDLGLRLMNMLQYPSGWYDEDGDMVRRDVVDGHSVPENYIIKSPFIPLFTNLCTSSSGGKDITLDTYETEGDHHGNRMVFPTGADDSFTVSEITLDIADGYGSLMFHLINLWVMWIYYYCKGVVSTRYKYLKKRILDFSCSIYIFTTDIDHVTINRMIKYTGNFPRNIPLGAVQHTTETNLEAFRNLSISFAVNRYEPMVPKIIGDFNKINRPFLMRGRGIQLPEPLIRPEILPADLLSKKEFKDFCPPIRELSNSEKEKGGLALLTKKDYDSQFFGKTPYIVGNKLLWFDVSKDNIGNEYMYKNHNNSVITAQEARNKGYEMLSIYK